MGRHPPPVDNTERSNPACSRGESVKPLAPRARGKMIAVFRLSLRRSGRANEGGTKSSNPLRSSGESANFWFLSADSGGSRGFEPFPPLEKGHAICRADGDCLSGSNLFGAPPAGASNRKNLSLNRRLILLPFHGHKSRSDSGDRPDRRVAPFDASGVCARAFPSPRGSASSR